MAALNCFGPITVGSFQTKSGKVCRASSSPDMSRRALISERIYSFCKAIVGCDLHFIPLGVCFKGQIEPFWA